jgi:osmoprotectant transport system substrate-binding protein
MRTTRRRSPWRLLLWAALVTVLALTLAACGGEDDLEGGGSDTSATQTPAATEEAPATAELPAITVGSANFPENVLLAEIYAGALQAKGAEVSKKLNVGSREALYPAIQNGDIDLLPEYTGALLSFVSKGEAEARDTEGQVTALTEALPAELVLLEPAAAEDKDSVTCTKEITDRLNLKSLDDLGPVSDQVVMGGPPELKERAGFGLPGLERVYGIKFKQFRSLDVAGPLTVAALKDNKIDCANLFSTQSAIAENGFVTLEDPKGIVEAENVIPLISKEKATPEVTETLNAVSAKLDTEGLKELVRQVEVDKDSPASVAEAWLGENGLTGS